MAELFGEVLALCAEAGLVRVGVIAVDGTKVHANASERATRSYEEIAREILEDAAAVDAEEDERFGDARGDELPSELATGQGRQRWLRDAKRRLDERRAAEAKPIPKSRPDRLKEAKRRLEEEHRVECRANEAYEDYRRHGRMRNGRRLGAHSPPKPYQPPEQPEGKINLTDPDSRNVKTPRGWVQGYNAQAVTTEDQIVIAAEVHVSSADFGQLEPMIAAARHELARAGVEQPPEVVLADAGYWHHVQMERLAGEGVTVLVPPDANKRARRAAGLERRALRVHASRLGHRPGRRALRQTPGHDRAGLRRHQVQPRHRPLLTPRPRRSTLGMAAHQRRSQPAQALATHHSARGGLRAAAR